MLAKCSLMSENASDLKDLSVRVDALRRAMDTIIAGSTPDHAKWVSYKSFGGAYNSLASKYIELSGDESIATYKVDELPNWASAVWPQHKTFFETIYAATLILSAALYKFDVGPSKIISGIEDLLVANLRKVIFAPPEREIEVQNSIESLLVGRGYQKGVDYDRESGKFKFSGREFIPDFVFAAPKMALEVKLIKSAAQVSSCVEQMSADTAAYLSAYENVLFCVYDLGFIRDVPEFQAGIHTLAGARVCVIKH